MVIALSNKRNEIRYVTLAGAAHVTARSASIISRDLADWPPLIDGRAPSPLDRRSNRRRRRRPAFEETMQIRAATKTGTVNRQGRRIFAAEEEITRRALGRTHIPPTKVFPRNKISRCSDYTISEKAIWFRHPDYNPDRAQKLISSSMSRRLSTRNISSKFPNPCTRFWVILLTDRQTNEHGQKHVPAPLSEVTTGPD